MKKIKSEEEKKKILEKLWKILDICVAIALVCLAVFFMIKGIYVSCSADELSYVNSYDFDVSEEIISDGEYMRDVSVHEFVFYSPNNPEVVVPANETVRINLGTFVPTTTFHADQTHDMQEIVRFGEGGVDEIYVNATLKYDLLNDRQPLWYIELNTVFTSDLPSSFTHAHGVVHLFIDGYYYPFGGSYTDYTIYITVLFDIDIVPFVDPTTITQTEIYQEGWRNGRQEGSVLGYNLGYADAKNSYDVGYKSSELASAFSAKYNEGYENGLTAGLEKNDAEVYNQGYIDGSKNLEVIRDMGEGGIIPAIFNSAWYNVKIFFTTMSNNPVTYFILSIMSIAVAYGIWKIFQGTV